MKDFIVILIIALILGLVIFYIYRSKKSGNKCIGCPYSKECSKCKCNENE